MRGGCPYVRKPSASRATARNGVWPMPPATNNRWSTRGTGNPLPSGPQTSTRSPGRQEGINPVSLPTTVYPNSTPIGRIGGSNHKELARHDGRRELGRFEREGIRVASELTLRQDRYPLLKGRGP